MPDLGESRRPRDTTVSKPDPGPTYPAYVVGDSDNGVDEIRVATVTKPKSAPDQLEDLLRRLLAGMAPPAPVPAPVPEVPMLEKLLQSLVAETQSRQLAPVIPPGPVGLEKCLRSYLSGQQTSGQQSRQRPARRGWNGVVCFSCGKAVHGATHCPALDESFPFMLPGWRFIDDFTSYGGGASSSGNRRLIRVGGPLGCGFTAQSSSKIQPQDPGGGAERIAAPRGVVEKCLLWSLSRLLHGCRWCWSRRPRLGALTGCSAHV